MDSLKELLTVLNNPKTTKLTEIRLKLRNELRKLIEKIDVFPEGSERFTIQSAKKALKMMSMIHPKGTKEYALQKKDIQRRLDNPKYFRYFVIIFTHGSFRFIRPEDEHKLSIDNLKETIVWPSSDFKRKKKYEE